MLLLLLDSLSHRNAGRWHDLLDVRAQMVNTFSHYPFLLPVATFEAQIQKELEDEAYL